VPAASRAWEEVDAEGNVIAVLDTGVDLDHPDLQPVLVPGWDFVDGDAAADDANGHGTHVAGIAAGVLNNGIGGAGVARGARVMPVRVLDHQGIGYTSDVAEGVLWAVEHGAEVVNLSLATMRSSAVLKAAVDSALAAGVPVVAAMGNEGGQGSPTSYPAAYPGVVAVGAVDSAHVVAPFSNRGSHIALVAPGVDVLSTVPGGYAYFDGTSMSTPFVSAAAALLLARDGRLSAAQVRDVLMGTAHDLGPAGHDIAYGAGLLDVLGAASAVPVTGPTGTTAPATFVPVDPVRVLDTRPGSPSGLGPKGRLGAGGSVTVDFAGRSTSAGPVPDDVTAVVLNVTAVRPDTGTYVRAFPAGAVATPVSSVNLPAGDVRPNHVTVKTGTGGAVVFRNAAGTTDLLVDLAGFYSPSVGDGFTPLEPVRLLDTRNGSGVVPLQGAVGSGGFHDLPVAGVAGVPAGATAVVLNLTAVSATDTTVVRAYPTSSTAVVPGISHLNVGRGQTVANLVTVRVGEGGKVRLRNSVGTVHLLADVAGYYDSASSGRFVAVDPLRLLDTRTGLGAVQGALGPGGRADLDLRHAGLPSGTAGVAVNLTAVAPTTGTFLRSWPTSVTMPRVSNLNLPAGDVRANAAAVSAGTSGVVRIRNEVGTAHVLADLAGYFVR